MDWWGFGRYCRTLSPIHEIDVIEFGRLSDMLSKAVVLIRLPSVTCPFSPTLPLLTFPLISLSQLEHPSVHRHNLSSSPGVIPHKLSRQSSVLEGRSAVSLIIETGRFMYVIRDSRYDVLVYITRTCRGYLHFGNTATRFRGTQHKGVEWEMSG